MKYIVKSGQWQAWDESKRAIPEELLPYVQDSPPELTPEQKAEMRIAEVDQQIQAKLPEIIRLIAFDDTKGFKDLKAEIKKIDQSVEVKSAQR